MQLFLAANEVYAAIFHAWYSEEDTLGFFRYHGSDVYWVPHVAGVYCYFAQYGHGGFSIA